MAEPQTTRSVNMCSPSSPSFPPHEHPVTISNTHTHTHNLNVYQSEAVTPVCYTYVLNRVRLGFFWAVLFVRSGLSFLLFIHYWSCLNKQPLQLLTLCNPPYILLFALFNQTRNEFLHAYCKLLKSKCIYVIVTIQLRD